MRHLLVGAPGNPWSADLLGGEARQDAWVLLLGGWPSGALSAPPSYSQRPPASARTRRGTSAALARSRVLQL